MPQKPSLRVATNFFLDATHFWFSTFPNNEICVRVIIDVPHSFAEVRFFVMQSRSGIVSLPLVDFSVPYNRLVRPLLPAFFWRDEIRYSRIRNKSPEGRIYVSLFSITHGDRNEFILVRCLWNGDCQE